MSDWSRIMWASSHVGVADLAERLARLELLADRLVLGHADHLAVARRDEPAA